MSVKCEVIRDLLPLYADGVVSDESRILIEEHLKDCAGCREYLGLLQEDVPDVDEVGFANEAAVLKKIKGRIIRNRILIVLITLAFAVIAGVVLHSMHLTEYNGSLEENLSYKVPAGYVLQEPSGDSNVERVDYTRDTAKSAERITLYYDGLYSSAAREFSADETFRLDDATEVQVCRYDWDNSYDNQLNFLILHENEAYTIEYQCQEKGKKNYYDSCREEQQEAIMAFIETMDFHRPDGSDMNAIQSLYRNFGVGGLIVLVLAILFFVGVPIAIAIAGFPGSKSKDDDLGNVISSRDLHDSMNRERASKGEPSLPSINTVQGVSSNNLARRDHSWSSVPDFFVKLFRRK